ncbi:competence protein ComEC [Mobilisporobacter senegalensis]|uniref:Competence protein ComEC n=1 Tax=Mobilisporobacter senegalensis TaxID=1329262 RepID=A0A3N1XVD5_9FIRM|nr:DNA internalization-related competence protein ComEC/Rec2 [Mobilisporobacter senegalensis]ROR30580.1 competence protein ComEC [Mobilisporobacter senegalensis]
MIKRPFVVILLSFILGSMLTKFKAPVVFGVISTVLILIILILYILKLSNRYVNSLDQFLILLPLFLYFGFVLMSRQQVKNPMDELFADKIMGNITGTVSMIVDKGENTVIYLKNNQIKISKHSTLFLSDQLILYSKNEKQLKIGNKISVDGEIHKFKPATNYGQFDEASYYNIGGIDYKVYEKHTLIIDPKYNWLKQRLYELKLKLVRVYSSILNDKNAGIVSAMLLGEKSLLEEEIKELYQQNGITHILAISGFHVSLIGLTFYKILNQIGLNQLASTLISTFTIYCYGVLTNFSVSTNRAVVMLIVSLFANVIGRTYDLLSAISLSALLILIQNPMEIYDAGFLLSFGAVLGIGIITPLFTKFTDNIFEDVLRKYKVNDNSNIDNKHFLKFLKGVTNSIFLCISINLITLPILIYFFYELPVYSLIVNLLIIPPMSVLTYLMIIGGMAGCFHHHLGTFFIGGAHYILEAYQTMCEFFQSMPGHMLIVGKPAFIQIIIYYGILITFVFVMKRYEKKRCFLILILLFIIFIHKNEKGLTITFLDVSQGDGIFIHSDSGTTYLIDGGSSDVSKVGEYRLEPFLKASGISTIDYALVTHADSDHISGLKELLGGRNEIKVKYLVLPDTSFKDEAYEELVSLAKSNKTKVLYIEKGDIIQDGDLSMTCLHPTPDYKTTSRNGYSTVLSLEYKDFKALFVGDIEKDGEKMILEEKNPKGEKLLLDYDLLKVAHHGSKYSSHVEFLKSALPEISIISCGRNNRYGHPHPELLKRLEEAGSRIMGTYEKGAITLWTDGEKFIIKSFLDQ